MMTTDMNGVAAVDRGVLGDVGVAALFVDPRGIYPRLLGMNRCWDEARDARGYGSHYATELPVVAHPPCHLWVNMAAVNWKRYRRQKPAWYPGGTDEGCFASALASVRRFGGVLEHPAGSHAWAAHNLCPPQTGLWLIDSGGWFLSGPPSFRYWVCEVWQSAPRYGHPARKRTWLLYCGARPPFELDWTRNPGTHQVGWFDRNKPTLSKRQASATPEAFARELIRLAAWSRGSDVPLAR